MASVAVVGAGAIGGVVAARLGGAGRHDVTVCVRSPFSELILETDEGSTTTTPSVLTSPEQGEPVDWILVATKVYDDPGAAAWLPALMGRGTRIAILQNGVDHRERYAAHAADAQITPVIVDIPVERTGPGRVRQRRPGRMTVADDEGGVAFANLFEGAGIRMVLTPDFRTEAWRKLALNCTGAVNALTLKPAEIARRDDIADLMRALVRECIAVGRREGAALDEALADEVIERFRTGPADSVNSILADRIAGRPMEIDTRNGVIVRLGRKHGLETPMNAAMVALLEASA